MLIEGHCRKIDILRSNILKIGLQIRMMKFLINLLFVLVFNLAYSQDQKIQYVKVEYEDFFTESINIVNCESFRKTFKNSIKIKLLKSKSDFRDVTNTGMMIAILN